LEFKDIATPLGAVTRACRHGSGLHFLVATSEKIGARSKSIKASDSNLYQTSEEMLWESRIG
jgi:hypothetical protein